MSSGIDTEVNWIKGTLGLVGVAILLALSISFGPPHGLALMALATLIIGLSGGGAEAWRVFRTRRGPSDASTNARLMLYVELSIVALGIGFFLLWKMWQ